MRVKRTFFKTLPVAIIFLVSIFLLRDFLFKPTFPETHDGQSHIARLANFYLAVLDRHFPFRWAPNLNYKFGYPVFNFNYYTPYLMALFPIKAGFDFETSLKLVFWFSLFIGGFFWYQLLKDRLGRLPATIAGIFYVAAPYQLVNILIRGSAGEIVGLGVLPFLLWSIYKLVHNPSRWTFLINTIGVSILFVTHNITAVFGAPLLLIYSLVLAAEKKAWRNLPVVAASFGLGIGMTLFFWLPALLEKQYTNMDKIGMSYEYIEHFPTLGQLVYSKWQYGFSQSGPEDGLPFELGPFHWVVSLLALGLLLVRVIKKKTVDWLVAFFGLGFVGTIVFMNEFTLPVWKVVPMVRYIQFPWRLLGFSLVAVAFLAGWLTKLFPKVGVALAIGAVGYLAIVAHPFGGFDWDNYFYYEWPFTSSIKGLNMPIWFDLGRNHKLEINKTFDLARVALFHELAWKTDYHAYEVIAPYKVRVMERTAYFPGWEVRVDGKLVPIEYQLEQYPGIISFEVPEGTHMVETELTENTPPRRWGDLLSLLSLGGLAFVVATGWFPYAKKINAKKIS